MITQADSRATDYKRFEGISDDDKPTEGVGVNSRFFELDTGDEYYFDGSSWAKIGSGGET